MRAPASSAPPVSDVLDSSVVEGASPQKTTRETQMEPEREKKLREQALERRRPEGINQTINFCVDVSMFILFIVYPSVSVSHHVATTEARANSPSPGLTAPLRG